MNFRLPVAVLLTATLAFSQSATWDSVLRIGPGRKVEVRQTPGKPVIAQFDSATPTAISIKKGSRIISIPRDNVTRVSFIIGKSRGAKAGISAGVTAAVLGGLIGIACASQSNCDGVEYALIGIPFYAAIAGGIAALFPPHKEPVYIAVPPGRP